MPKIDLSAALVQAGFRMAPPALTPVGRAVTLDIQYGPNGRSESVSATIKTLHVGMNEAEQTVMTVHFDNDQFGNCRLVSMKHFSGPDWQICVRYAGWRRCYPFKFYYTAQLKHIEGQAPVELKAAA